MNTDPVDDDRHAGGARRAAVVVSAGVLVCGATLLASSAHADYREVPETGTEGRLVLLSDPYPVRFDDLSPGETHYWQVAATIQGAPTASLVLEVRKSGELVEHPGGLVVAIERCDTAWTGVEAGDPQCSGGRAPVTRATPTEDYALTSPVFDLDGVDERDGTHLLVALGLETDDTGDETLMGLEGDIALGLTAAADDPAQPPTPGVPVPPPALPVTGADPLGLLLAALGAVGLGLVALATRMRRIPSARTVQSEGAAQRARTATNEKDVS